MKGHSLKCRDLATYWEPSTKRCAKCKLRPGYEVSPNCGRDDGGGIHELGLTSCQPNYFNPGTNPLCSPCSPCQSGSEVLELCTSTADTVCKVSRTPTLEQPRKIRPTTTTSLHVISPRQPEVNVPTAAGKEVHEPTKTSTIPPLTTSDQFRGPQSLYAVYAVLAVVVVMALAAFFIHRKWRGQGIKMCLYKGSAAENQELSPVPYSLTTNEPEDILSDDIQSASLQGVLDNLDVLEELVILLDPETQGIKNTKHLASLCSFPSPWVTYVYSMKDSKSPLKAVLERLISSHPDWTVGHLARLLKEMKRNDAIAVLTKLRPSLQAYKY